MKKKKPQGKLNHKIVMRGLLAGKKKKDIAKEAGSIAKDDSSLINSINRAANSDEFKKEAAPFVKQMQEERQRMLDEIKVKDIGEVRFKDLVEGIDKFTKNIELLSGNATERTNLTVNPEKKAGIEKALEDL